MQEPSVRTSRIAIAGGIAAALCVGGAGFLIGRSTVPPSPATKPAIVAPIAPVEAKPDTSRMLNRGDLTSAAARTADALASGAAAPAGLDDLSGRRFAVALPFGCTGAAGADSPAPLQWSYDDAAQALRVHIGLVVWQPDEWGTQADASSDTPTVPQGFWVTRPWSSAETCPIRSSTGGNTSTEPVTLPGQTLALVSFAAGLPSGRGYDAVVRIPRDKLDIRQGLRARITGRIDRIPGDGAVHCVQPAGIDQHPVCAVAALFDELVVDNPATGNVIATWTLGKIGERGDAGRN